MSSANAQAHVAALRSHLDARLVAALPEWIRSWFAGTELQSDDELLAIIASCLGTSGTRVRPLFLLLGHQTAALKGSAVASWSLAQRQSSTPALQQQLKRIPETLWQVAMAVELFHAAAQAGDDWLDDDGIRHGVPALYVALGRWAAQRCRPPAHADGALLQVIAGSMTSLWQALIAEVHPEYGERSLSRGLLAESWQRLHSGPASSPPERRKELFAFVEWVLQMLARDQDQLELEEIQDLRRMRLVSLLSYCHDMFRLTLAGKKADLGQSFPRAELPGGSLLGLAGRIAYEKSTVHAVEFPLLVGCYLQDRPFVGIGRYSTTLPMDCMRRFAGAYGELLQMRDDLLLFRPQEHSGKNPATDLLNGALTLVTAAVHDSMSNIEGRRYFSALLSQCRQSAKALETAFAFIHGSGVVEHIEQQLMPPLADSCQAALEQLGRLGYYTHLLEHVSDDDELAVATRLPADDRASHAQAV